MRIVTVDVVVFSYDIDKSIALVQGKSAFRNHSYDSMGIIIVYIPYKIREDRIGYLCSSFRVACRRRFASQLGR